MESNQPINKINSNENWTDGSWDGALIGAGVSLGAVGVAHGGMSFGTRQSRRDTLVRDKSDAFGNFSDVITKGGTPDASLAKQHDKLGKKIDRLDKASEFKGKHLGGLRGVAAYGGSALLGGIAGGITDYVRD